MTICPTNIEVRCYVPELKKTLVVRHPQKGVNPGNAAEQGWKVMLTADDIRRAVERLKANNVRAPYYVVRVHPANAATVLIEWDARLSYSDRCLAAEWYRYELRRSDRGLGWRDPYAWICERLSISPLSFADMVSAALGPSIRGELSGG